MFFHQVHVQIEWQSEATGNSQLRSHSLYETQWSVRPPGKAGFKTNWPLNSPSNTKAKQVFSCKGQSSRWEPRCLQTTQPARCVGSQATNRRGEGPRNEVCPGWLWLPLHTLPHPFFWGMQPWSQSAWHRDINHSNSLWGDLLAPGKHTDEWRKKKKNSINSRKGQRLWGRFVLAHFCYRQCTLSRCSIYHFSVLFNLMGFYIVFSD